MSRRGRAHSETGVPRAEVHLQAEVGKIEDCGNQRALFGVTVQKLKGTLKLVARRIDTPTQQVIDAEMVVQNTCRHVVAWILLTPRCHLLIFPHRAERV